MWKLGSFSQNSRKPNEDLAVAKANAIRVMVIDNNKDFLVGITSLLKACSFEVTTVDHAGTGLTILSERKDEFDLLLVDSNLSDIDAHAVLRLTSKMDVQTILISDEDDDELLSRAFADGALLVLKRPLTLNMVKELRQHAIRKRIKKLGKGKAVNLSAVATKERVCEVDDGLGFGVTGRRQSDEPKNYTSKRSSVKNLEFLSYQNEGDYSKKKVCVEWTDELHARFVDAVNQLGEGRCYPKDIHELMDVPGLTRMQVASHLQKCRNNKWKSSRKRKAPDSSSVRTSPSNHSERGLDARKFGCMPPLNKGQDDQQVNNASEAINTALDLNLSVYGRPDDARPMSLQNLRGFSLMNAFDMVKFL